MNKKYRITKIDSVDNPSTESHFGESKEFHVGYFVAPPKEGERFQLIGFSFQNEGIITSTVTKIIDDSTFETKNSVYKYEPYE